MNNKHIYNIGCVLLFFGLLWMMVPHALHSKAERALLGISDSEAEESSHYTHLLEGLGVVIVALGIMKYAELRMLRIVSKRPAKKAT